MDIALFLRSLLIGLSIAAVVGPIGMLAISRTMQKGFLYGFVTGMGAATADATYGSIAAFSLTLLSNFLLSQAFWIRLLGGLFLLYLGIRTVLKRPALEAAKASGNTLLLAYSTTVLLTLTNPLTILSFAAIFAGMGLGTGSRDGAGAVLVVLGVFSGSGLWWLILCTGVSLLRTRLTRSWLLWINRVTGLALILFGLVALGSLWL